jgi:cell division protein FtsL
MGNETKTMKVIDGRSVVLSIPSVITIVIILVGIIAAYFATYSDLRAEVTSNHEKIQAQEKYFEKEFQRIHEQLREIKGLIRNRREK